MGQRSPDAFSTAETIAPASGVQSPSSAEVTRTSGVSGSGSVDVSSPTLTSLPAPTRIGRYKVIRLMGAGGMGAVYEALQDQPQRVVALKVLRGTLATPSLQRRFEYESQLLARLRHPGIAQVYDAGTHHIPETGEVVPYFAMELIPDARSLTQYAAGKVLTLRDRVELFVRVCDAVHHAHLRGVIHRDLKPANILVDVSGQPKIIDFGVAYAPDAEGAVMTEHADRAPLVGTLQYMAPEQCGVDRADIDARADVFALGLILYELLTGKPAYSIRDKPLAAVLATVREAKVPMASLAEPSLRGDLETIIRKAASPARNERYDSAAALHDDLRRWLMHEPILARPIWLPRRMLLWVRRNQAVAAVGAASLAIIAAVSLVLAGRIIAETRRANQNLRIAEQNLRAAKQNFAMIKNLFASMRPNEQQRGLVDMVQLLDGAASRLDDAPPELPGTEADFREFLSESYRGVGLYAPSIAQQRKVVELRRRLAGGPNPELANSVHQLAASLWWNGQYDEAGPLYEESLAMRRALYGARHPDIATSLTHMGAYRLRQGRLAEAEALYAQALEMRRSLPNTPREQIAASLNNLAKAIQLRGHYDRAEQLFTQAYQTVVAAVGEGDIQTAHAANNLGLCLIEAGKPAEALRFLEQALAIRTARYRAGHHLISLSKLAVARARFDLQPGPEPLALARAAADDLIAALPPGHPDIIESYVVMGRMYLRSNDPVSAEIALRSAIEEVSRSSQASPRERAAAMLAMAECLIALDRPYDASQKLDEGVRLLEGIDDLAPLQRQLTELRARIGP